MKGCITVVIGKVESRHDEMRGMQPRCMIPMKSRWKSVCMKIVDFSLSFIRQAAKKGDGCFQE